LDGDLLARVLELGDGAADDRALAQHLAQRDDDVPRLHAPGRGLGQERLVRHVRLRFDDGDLGRPARQLLLQAERGVHTDVAAADYQDPYWSTSHASTLAKKRLCAHTGTRPGDRRHGVSSAAIAAARANTASSIGSVSLPVNVFC